LGPSFLKFVERLKLCCPLEIFDMLDYNLESFLVVLGIKSIFLPVIYLGDKNVTLESFKFIYGIAWEVDNTVFRWVLSLNGVKWKSANEDAVTSFDLVIMFVSVYLYVGWYEETSFD